LKQQEVKGHAANVHNVDRLQKWRSTLPTFSFFSQQKREEHAATHCLFDLFGEAVGVPFDPFSPSFATRRSTHRNLSSFCSKSQFRRDPLGVLEALLWKTGKQLAISEHGARSCVYAEGEAVIHKHKAGPEEVKRQLDFYRAGKFCVTKLST
jgi:hypothetical protein